MFETRVSNIRNLKHVPILICRTIFFISVSNQFAALQHYRNTSLNNTIQLQHNHVQLISLRAISFKYFLNINSQQASGKYYLP